jgi:hypothetical protein
MNMQGVRENRIWPVHQQRAFQMKDQTMHILLLGMAKYIKGLSWETIRRALFVALLLFLIFLASIMQPVALLPGGNVFYTYFVSGLIVLSTLAILAL